MNKTKSGILETILYTCVGALFYFGFFMIVKKGYDGNPLELPFIIFTVYFAICTVLFPISGRRLSEMEVNAEKKSVLLNILHIPQISFMVAYLFAPIVLIVAKNK